MSEIKKCFYNAKYSADGYSDLLSIAGNQFSALQTYWQGLSGYTNDFFVPYLLATNYFQRIEVRRLLEEAPVDSIQAYLGLLENNLELMTRSLNGTAVMVESYMNNEADELIEALKQSLIELNPKKLSKFTARQANLLDLVLMLVMQKIMQIQKKSNQNILIKL